MKKKNSPSNRRDIASLSIFPGTLVLAACLLAAFLLMLILLWRGSIIPRPAAIDSLFTPEVVPDEKDIFSEKFLASLNGRTEEISGESPQYLNMTDESLYELLLAAVRAPSLYQTATVTWTYGSSFRSLQIYFLAAGSAVRAEAYQGIERKKCVIADEDTFYIREGIADVHFARSDDAAFTPEGEIGLPSITRMQQLLVDAENGIYEKSFQTLLNSACIRVIFTDPHTGVKEIYEVLPDCGAILSAYSYLPGSDVPYYLMTTNMLMTDLSGFDPSLFAIPNS